MMIDFIKYLKAYGARPKAGELLAAKIKFGELWTELNTIRPITDKDRGVVDTVEYRIYKRILELVRNDYFADACILVELHLEMCRGVDDETIIKDGNGYHIGGEPNRD